MARPSEATSFGAVRDDVGSREHLDAVRHQLRRRQDVAQIVADLGNRLAERGQPGPGPERRVHLALHLGDGALGIGDLAQPAAAAG